MSVLIVTSLGDIVVDLLTDRCPLTCKNFLKLCKIKYYSGCLFHTVQKDFTAQTGDPTGTGSGGDSIYKFLYGDQARFFGDEIHLDLKHSEIGTIAMASAGENLNASQFYITLRENLDSLDGNHTVFGKVAEGLETLERINGAYVDQDNRPFKNIRIKHTYVLDDPFDDPPQLSELVPDASPEGKPKDEVVDEVRLEDDWVPLDEKLDTHKLEEVLREKEAYSREVVLEAIQDIPEAGVKPPENVLFVCKLNPVTEDEDLHTIFSRFGTVKSAEIIRDYKTGDSLCYAFIEFEDEKSCEEAYFKMDNALIDDRRIHVDFSQSVMKLWSEYRGKMHKGKGCHKCGSVDHIAKDCTIDTSNEPQAHPKYVLKDDNTQYGGKDKSRYEMVFDGDAALESPKAGKRRRYDEQQEGGKERENRRGSGIDGGKDSYHSAHKDLRKDSREDRRRRHGDDDDDDDRKVYEKRQHEKRQEYHSSRVKDTDRREYEKGGHHANDRHSRDRRREEAKDEKGRHGDGERDIKRDDRGNEKVSAGNKESRDRRGGYEKAEYSVDRKGGYKERIDEKERGRRTATSEEDDDRRHERREKTYDRERPRRH